MKAKKRTPSQHPGLEALLRAIIDDARSKARQLLAKEPQLALCLMEKPRLIQSKFAHWLYARDTPLHLAAAGHRLEITRLLLAAGADPNAAHNHRQGRPLHYAADGFQSPSFDPARQVKTITCLLQAGADLHAADKNGATALHRAVRTRSAAAVEFLLKAGADPAARNHPGSTPFHLAVQNTGRGGTASPAARAAQHQIIQSMLAHGVSPQLKDAHGKSVLDWAMNDGLRRALSGSAA